MADLRVSDAPELSAENIEDGLKLPTGGFGNYAITTGTIANWLVNYKDLATKTFVKGELDKKADISDVYTKEESDEINNTLLKKTVKYVSSIQKLLEVENPLDEMVYEVSNYYEDILGGGGRFQYYEKEKGNNNGVTVIDGWVRDTSSKVLTTQDAGLIGDGEDTDVSIKIQNIADVLTEGFTLNFVGDLKLTTSILFSETKSLTLQTIKGELVGDYNNWSWGEPIETTNRRGLLVFNGCENLHITRMKVKGVDKNIFGSFQDGDSCLQLINCNNPIIDFCTLGDCFAWAIIAEGCQSPVVIYNNIKKVTHQSGINVCVGGGTNPNISFNDISDCGLYGIEFETYTPFENDTYKAIGNTISDCFSGIAIVGQGVTSSEIRDNRISGCGYTGFMIQRVPNSNDILIQTNNFIENYRGAILKDCPNLKFINNVIDGKTTKDSYFKINPDLFVLKQTSTTTALFYSEFNIPVGQKMYLGGKSYTVKTVTDYEDPSKEFEYENLKLVSIEEAFGSDVRNKHVQNFLPKNYYTEATITILNGSNNMLVNSNVLSGGLYGIYYEQEATPESGVTQIVSDNEILDFGTNAILQNQVTEHIYYINNKTRSTLSYTFQIPDEIIENNTFKVKSYKTVVSNNQEAPDTLITKFSGFDDVLALGFNIVLLNPTASEDIWINVNGFSRVYKDVSNIAETGGIFVRYNTVMQKGLNTVSVSNSDDTLSFETAFIEVLTH